MLAGSAGTPVRSRPSRTRSRLGTVWCAVLAAWATSLTGASTASAGPGFAEVVWKVPGARLPALAWKPMRTARIVASHDGSTIFAPGAKGLRALRADTGALLWTAETDDPIASTPLVASTLVYVADVSGALHALGVRNGVAAFETPRQLNATVRAPLAGDAERIYAVTEPGNVMAIDRRSGKVLWRRASAAGRDFLAEGTSSPLVVGDQVVAGMADGTLVVVHGRDGGMVWSRELAGSGEGQPDVDTTPVAIGAGPAALVLAASQRGGMYALRLEDGEQRWHVPGEGFRTPLIRGPVALALRGDHQLVALRWTDGAVLRSRKLDGEPSGDMALCDLGVLVPAGDGLWLLDGDSLHARGRIVDPYGFAAAPLVAGDAAWVVGNDGSVYAMRLHTPRP